MVPELEEAAAITHAGLAECEKCKWLMGFEYGCLLGRNPERCKNNPARRGDDDLVERLLAMSVAQQSIVRQRFENTDEGLRRLEMMEREDD